MVSHRPTTNPGFTEGGLEDYIGGISELHELYTCSRAAIAEIVRL